MAGMVGSIRRFLNTTTTSFHGTLHPLPLPSPLLPFHHPSHLRFKMNPSLIINNAGNYVNNIGLVLALLDSWLVTGLNKRTTSEKLMEAFSQFGEVIQAGVATDRVSGFSKGFGYVRYVTIEEAEQGIKGMDGQINL